MRVNTQATTQGERKNRTTKGTRRTPRTNTSEHASEKLEHTSHTMNEKDVDSLGGGEAGSILCGSERLPREISKFYE